MQVGGWRRLGAVTGLQHWGRVGTAEPPRLRSHRLLALRGAGAAAQTPRAVLAAQADSPLGSFLPTLISTYL